MKQQGWRHFLKLCLSAENEKNLSALFEIFLTQEERENIATRYLIVSELLKQKNPQRKIAEDLQVSIAKITRGSNELKRSPAKIIEFLKMKIFNP